MTPMAWGCTDEEQGHKTLHSNWSIWIEDFDSIRSLLYHNNENVRKQALHEIKNILIQSCVLHMAMSLLNIIAIQEQCTQCQIKFYLILFLSYYKICVMKITVILPEALLGNALTVNWNLLLNPLPAPPICPHKQY
eukprot:434169-Ditylum_brightwellii.AAC.1